ncbi:hypothetical protein BV898_06546 [Hypsibius exemplaris]|uniref:Apple domain-containing protein n=1 Tax=Hypsibius exemplaris TaxID=2072580 RepID=A0A1W0WW51_HYPEX|nr:hypothetical protein BV898_06546 [Hypsibius exemplaris]
MMLKLVLIVAVLRGSIAVSSRETVAHRGAELGMFDFNCDFHGHNIGFLETSGKDRARVCRNDRSCTYFTHHGSTCNLKRSNR